MLYSKELVRKAIFDSVWRTMTALGRKVASSIEVSPRFFGECESCGRFDYIHPEIYDCQECIVGDPGDDGVSVDPSLISGHPDEFKDKLENADQDY